MVDFTKKTEKNMPRSSIKFEKTKAFNVEQKENDHHSAIKFQNDIEVKKLEAEKLEKSRLMFDMENRVNMKSEPSGFNKTRIFDNSENPIVKNLLAYIQTNYNDVYLNNPLLLSNMAKKLISPTCKIIDNWGDDVLTEQKELVQTSARRISEFNGLDVNKVLNDVIDGCKPKSSIVNKFFKNKPSFEEFNLKINALKVHLDGLSDSIDECIKNCKSNKLDSYLSVLSAYAETTKGLPDDLDQSLFNRRRLLQQALQNIQIACSQLEQVKTMIANAKNEASHILNVTLPSLSLIDINK